MVIRVGAEKASAQRIYHLLLIDVHWFFVDVLSDTLLVISTDGLL
jgi:hypothetical protein